MLVMFVSCLLVNFGRLKEQLHSHCGGGVVYAGHVCFLFAGYLWSIKRTAP